MRTRTTLILVGSALTAVLFFVLVEEPRHAEKTERAVGEKRLTPTDAEDVFAVSIARPDVGIEAVREGTHWRLSSPVVDAADDPAFNTLVLTLCRAVVDQRFEVDESRLEEYGLDPPLARVRLESKDERGLLEVRIGHLNPSQSHCYAVVGDEREVLLLPSGARRYALRPLFEFRDKKIVSVEVSDVDRIVIASPRGDIVWTARDTHEWFSVLEGDTIVGDKRAIENIVRELRGLRATDIPFGGPAADESPLAQRAGAIDLSLRGDSVVSLVFGPPRDGGCYVRDSRRQRVAIVDTTILAVFRRAVADFRYKRILRFETNSLARIVWATQSQTTAVLKTDGGWSYANPGYGAIDQRAARRLLSTLETLEFSAVIDEKVDEPTGHGFDNPVFRVTLFDSDGRVIDETIVGSLSPEASSRYLWSRSTGVVATIAVPPLERLESDLSNLGGP